MTFRDGQARGPRNHAMSCVCRAPPFRGLRSPCYGGLCRRSLARTAGARSHRIDGGRCRSARRRRSAGAPLGQLPRRAGPGPDEASRYARGYFIANQSVHLLTRIESLEFPAPDEARVKLQVGMAGRGGEPGAANLSADLYDFDLALVREGERVEGQLRGLAARIDAGVDLCNMRSILRVVFNRPPAKRSMHAHRAAHAIAPTSPAESTI